jgi:hypothetical protein
VCSVYLSELSRAILWCSNHSMPLQNRVDPFGVIFRAAARGTFLGNRGGALHNEAREIVRTFKSRRWIACVLEFRGRKRTIMAPNRYTELFFLDEAVAFAAGHRPCAECRRERFNAFQLAWACREGASANAHPGADEIDLELHRNRIDRRRNKVTYQAALKTLPNGSFVQIDGAPWLVWEDSLLLWTPERYVQRTNRSNHSTVTVLTPQPIVQCFRGGYEPAIHESALKL